MYPALHRLEHHRTVSLRRVLSLCLSARLRSPQVCRGIDLAAAVSENVTVNRALLTRVACSFLVLLPLHAAAAGPLERSEKQDRSEWTAVRNLSPGTAIILTVKGAMRVERAIVGTSETALTLFKLDAATTLPPAVTRVLLDLVSSHPEYLMRTPGAGQFVNQDVRVGPDGVFQGRRKVVDLEQVVETLARDEIAEATIRHRGRGVWGHLGGLGGYFVGAVAGGYIAGLGCKAAAASTSCDSGAFLIGTVVGGIAGSVQGFRASRRETEDVIYRAP